MVNEAEIVAAIDVGTTKVFTILGRKGESRRVHVLGHSTVPCDGLRKGNVTDVAATARALKASVAAVEKQSGHKVSKAFVGVTGSHVAFENRRETMVSAKELGVITSQHLNRIPTNVAGRVDDTDRKVIHAIPITFTVDGTKGIRNPLGMHGRSIQVETHTVTGASKRIDKLLEAVKVAGIEAEVLVLEPLASGLAVLTSDERRRGAVVLDIGGGTTDVVVFRNGSIRYTGVIPVGGFQFTNDIAYTFGVSYGDAEEAKLAYANVEPHVPGSDEQVRLNLTGGKGQIRVSRQEICQLARERAHELAQLIKIKLHEADVGELTKLQYVLTGGTSNLPGIEMVMQRTLTPRLRGGSPKAIRGIPDELQRPTFATGVGILVWGMNEYVPAPAGSRESNGHSHAPGRKSLVSALFGQLGRLWPSGLSLVKGRN